MAMDLTTTNADTPPRPTPNKPMGFLAYANGALKRHYPTAPSVVVPKPDSPPPPISIATAVSYKECMRNHAATIGGHALDGCCEFMPSPTFNISDPNSLQCAACGCHRNFHRRDPDDPAPLQLHRQIKSFPPQPIPSESPSSPPTPATFASAPHMLVSLKKSHSGGTPLTAPGSHGGSKYPDLSSAGKKRFRTKFSHEQKEKMYEFSEKLGWKLQKIDKTMVEEFCKEIGVGKEVLKVWMHNNKNTLGRIKDINNGGNSGGDTKFACHFEPVHLVSANASSSSSG